MIQNVTNISYVYRFRDVLRELYKKDVFLKGDLNGKILDHLYDKGVHSINTDLQNYYISITMKEDAERIDYINIIESIRGELRVFITDNIEECTNILKQFEHDQFVTFLNTPLICDDYQVANKITFHL